MDEVFACIEVTELILGHVFGTRDVVGFESVAIAKYLRHDARKLFDHSVVHCRSIFFVVFGNDLDSCTIKMVGSLNCHL